MSYAIFPKGVIVRACREYLDARNERIKTKQEEIIQKNMNGLFGKRSRESVIKSLEGDIFNEYGRVAITGGMYANRVEKLLSLAETAPNDIFVDAEDADILRKFL